MGLLKSILENYNAKQFSGYNTVLVEFTGSIKKAVILNKIIFLCEKYPNEYVYHTYSKLCKETGIYERTVRRLVKELADNGLIITKIKKLKNNTTAVHYKLADDFYERLTKFLEDKNVHNNPVGTSNLATPLYNIISNNNTNNNITIKEENRIHYNNKLTNTVKDNKLEDNNVIDNNVIDNKDKVIKRKEVKYSSIQDLVLKVHKTWNESKIINHKKLNSKTQSLIIKALEYISAEDLLQAIKNYGQIVNDNKFYYSSKISLQMFLDKGIHSGKGFYYFIPEADPFNKFLSSEFRNPFDLIRHEFHPITEEYNPQNIADFKNNTYYGFPIKDFPFMFEYADMYGSELLKIVDYKDYHWDYNKFYLLEESIATLLYQRKTNPQIESLSKLFDKWKELLHVFKNQVR